MILKETVVAIADAIREKTGKSELIKPVDFATEIKGITAGGGDAPSGGSNMEYWDISANSTILGELALFTPWVKVTSEYGTDILSAYHLTTHNIQPIAIALDRSIEIVLEGNKMSVEAMLDGYGLADLTQLGWVRITKEQFYTLE